MPAGKPAHLPAQEDGIPANGAEAFPLQAGEAELFRAVTGRLRDTPVQIDGAAFSEAPANEEVTSPLQADGAGLFSASAGELGAPVSAGKCRGFGQQAGRCRDLSQTVSRPKGSSLPADRVGFSPKQAAAISWWRPDSPYCGREAIICDGAVRSGKTLAMGLGFFLWAMTCFTGRQFALCGKSVVSLRRNVLSQLLPWLQRLGMQAEQKRSQSLMQVKLGQRENQFYLFGGYDESSQDAIQGATFAGVLLDEAALMPRSFIEQACARCSVAGSRLWFSCNPESPGHWFYREWVLKAGQKNCLHLHFLMEDNPALPPAIRRRYERLYEGAFYRRYVLGQWVAAEGRVYDFFTSDMAGTAPQGPYDDWYISCDYGTVNPASFGLWGLWQGVWYRVAEYYFDSRRSQVQRTDKEYAQALEALAGDRPISAVVVDPSAASFITLLCQQGWKVIKAENDVLSGIRMTADALKEGRIVICRTCTDCLREIEDYVWDLSAGEKDKVVKRSDHAMDDMRYFVSTVLAPAHGGFAATTAERNTAEF